MTSKIDQQEPGGELTVDRAIDTLLHGDDDRLYELMAQIDAAPRSVRLPLRDRIAAELTSRVPADPSRDSADAARVRGWLLSAAAVATPEPDVQLEQLLVPRLDWSVEPSEWVRHWALANYAWKFPSAEAKTPAGLAERDPSDLVRALAVAVQASRRSDAVEQFIAALEGRGKLFDAWGALRALQVTSSSTLIPAVIPAVINVLRRARPTPQSETRERDIYEGLLALGTPHAVPLAAPELDRAFGPGNTVVLVLTAARGARRSKLSILARILSALPDRKGVIDKLRAVHETSDDAGKRLAWFFLQQLGVPPDESRMVQIPSGADRIDFVYKLVLNYPAHFELLETFNPARVREVAQTLSSPLPDVDVQPNALWRAWVETVHTARLSEE